MEMTGKWRFANVWQHKTTGEQFLGLPWRPVRSYCDGATLMEGHYFRRVGVLRVKLKDRSA